MTKYLALLACTALLGACTLKINHSPEKFQKKFGGDAKPVTLPIKLSDAYKNLVKQAKACYQGQKVVRRTQMYRNGMPAGVDIQERTYGVKTEEKNGKKIVLITYEFFVPGLVKNDMKSFVGIAELSSENGKTILLHYQKHKEVAEALEAWASGETGHACPELGKRLHYSDGSSPKTNPWLVASDDL